MKKAVFLLCSALLSSHAAFAMNTQGVDEQDVEVIEIIGQFSKAEWGKIADQAKIDFYALYNQFNDIEKFRMVCRPEKQIGSNIKRNVCEPMYFKDAMLKETQLAAAANASPIIDLNRLPAVHARVLQMTKQTKVEADQHMEKLINEHPDLRKKFEYYAKSKMASELREKMDD